MFVGLVQSLDSKASDCSAGQRFLALVGRLGTISMRLCRSPALLVAIMLVAFDFGLASGRPLKNVYMGGYLPSDRNPLAAKYHALTSLVGNLDVLMLGSSLIVYGTYMADKRSGRAVPRPNSVEIASYTGAGVFTQDLREAVGHPLSTFNFAGPGCMVSDALLILQTAINQGHKPSSLVFGLAPRDFIDNMVGPYGNTAYNSFFRSVSPPPDRPWTSLASAIAGVQAAINRNWLFLRLRADYHMLASLLACQVFDRKPDLFTAVNTKGANASVCLMDADTCGPGDNAATDTQMAASLETYKRQYLPLNLDRYALELSALNKIGDLCRKQSVRLIVLNMPLTRENRDLLPADFKGRYARDIRTFCTTYRATMVDLSGRDFARSDFSDSVHLNGTGSLRLWKYVMRDLKRHGAVASMSQKSI